MLDELLDGRISLAHARAMASQLAGLNSEVADKVTGEVMNPAVAEDPEGSDGPLPPPVHVFTGGVLSPGQVRRRARTAREKHHQEPLDVRCQKAADHRSVRLEEVGDGMAYLEAFLPTVTAHAIDDRLRTTADQARKQGDPRTRAQLRADALADLLLAATPGSAPAGSVPAGPDSGEASVRVPGDGVPAGTPGTDDSLTCRVHDHSSGAGDAGGGRSGSEDGDDAEGNCEEGAPGHTLHPDEHDDRMWLAPLARSIRPVVHVTVPLLRVAGLPDHEELDPGAGPAMLDGHVPVDDETAVRLIAQAPSLRRLLTHPETGAVVSVGRDSYVVPADLREYLKVRDVTCRWPGCSARAERCDIDHATDWAHGGRTDHDNLVHLCRAHHITKHQTRWTSHLAADGTITWTSPTGRRYTTHPQGHLTSGKEPPGRALGHGGRTDNLDGQPGDADAEPEESVARDTRMEGDPGSTADTGGTGSPQPDDAVPF